MALKDTIAGAVDSAKELLHIGAEPDQAQSPAEADAREAAAAQKSGADAIDLLKADHRKVEALFKEILAEKSSTLSSQRKNVALVLAELTLHAKIEETIVYPAVRAKTKRDSDERLEVLEAIEEHGAMKDLMRKISKSAARDETLKAKVQVLMEIVEHHVKEEESEFFPEAKKLLGEKKLEQIGSEIVKIKTRAARRSAGAPKRRKTSLRKAVRKRA